MTTRNYILLRTRRLKTVQGICSLESITKRSKALGNIVPTISSNRSSSIGSNASIASVSSVQIYKYESPQKSQLTDTSGTRFSVAKYFPGGDKFTSVKHRSTSVVSNDSSFDKTSSSISNGGSDAL